ncbi:MAG: glycosyltransferase family 4 protein [Anaerolineales bacterium]|nr:glycosyltransferase family 4 protein [Anaerolineales bacterium]
MENKIAINGRYLSRRITGVERYAHEVSKRLHSSRIVQPKRPLRQMTGNFWEQLILPGRIKQHEILWSPANAGPWLIKNQVITIHDASVFDHPEWFKSNFAAWTRLSWRILAHRVKAVITVSNFSRERLKKHLGIPDKKIHMIYNGVGKPFEPQTQDVINKTRSKYKLGKPYFLFAGRNEPRKNLTTLIQAWEGLNSKTHDLFIAGMEGNIFAPISSHARSVTYIPDEYLPALYSGATAFILPSFYEGFGLPALEAMACSTPVIASDIPAFREIFKDAALFAKPHDASEITNVMQNIIDDPSLANTVRERGLQLVKKYSWDEAALKTQALLESRS